MHPATLYHNPNCSKSRQTLEILEQRRVEVTLIHYLQTPVDAAGLKELLTQMQIPVRTLLRTNNDTYRALKLDDQSLSEQRLIEQIATHPELMQRPIVVTPKGTRICRPPEKVLEIL